MSSPRHAIALIGLAGLLGPAGCHLIFPFDGQAHVVDAAGDGADAGRPELGPREAGLEGGADGPADAPGADASKAWWHPSWPLRKSIEIPAGTVTADLTGFVLMVDLGAQADLLAQVQPQGQDLKFVLPGGVNPLPHELEAPDAAAAHLVAWVRLPTLTAGQDTRLYVYYGNPLYTPPTSPPSPWDTSFAGVWHLSEVPGKASVARDGTPNGNHATFYGAMEAKSQAPGMVAGSLTFDGVDDRLTAPSSASLELGKTITISAWVNAFAFPASDGTIVSKAPTYGTANTDYLLRSGAGWLNFSAHNGATLPVVSFTGWTDVQSWHHVAGSYDGAYLRLFFDGKEVAKAPRSGPIRTSKRQLNIGSFGTADPMRTWMGEIDEVRISAVARPAAWIAAEFKNQSTPTVFYTIGPAEAKPGP